MGNQYVPWPNEDLAVLREVYPSGGWKAVARRVNKGKDAITQTAKRYGVRKIRKDGKPHRSKREVGHAEQHDRPYQYQWPPIDPATLALQSFAYITRAGQLRPIVRVELEVAA